MRQVRDFLADKKGATAIEYCMIAGSIALIIVVSLTTIGTKLQHYFLQIAAVN